MTNNIRKQNKNLPVTEVKSDGKRGMYGGAYTIAFVYSNKGNFVVKGYYREVKKHLDELKQKGYKYFCNFSLWNSKGNYGLPVPDKDKHRDIWSFYNDNISITHPTENFTYQYGKRGRSRKKYQGRKWTVKSNLTNVEFSFKRMPKRWIEEFDLL